MNEMAASPPAVAPNAVKTLQRSGKKSFILLMFFCLFSSPNNRKHLPTLNQILYIKHFSDKKNKNSKQEALSWMYSSLSS